MNAIVVEEFGPSSVLQFKKLDIPDVPDSMVLVKIKYSGVNPVDTYIRSGAFTLLPELPYIPGMDGSGVVTAVGKNVTRFKVQQRVFICGMEIGKYGTYAEYSLVPEKAVFPLDDRLNFEQGAALGIPYFTAYRALVLSAKCSPGETVLVHGASGAVGIACVQLAKSRGLRVIGTAGTSEGMCIVKGSGAHFVLYHKDQNYMKKVLEITENAGVNIIVEMLANKNLNDDLDVLAQKGRIAIVGCRGAVMIAPRKMMMPELQIMGVALRNSSEDEWNETSRAILQGIKDGWVNPVIDKSYTLSEAVNAQEDMINSSGAKGKIVLSLED